MRGARDELEPLPAGEPGQGVAVYSDNRSIGAANDEQGGRADASQRLASQIRASPAQDDRGHTLRALGGGDECRASASAGTEVADAKLVGVLVLGQPVSSVGKTARQQADVETEVACLEICDLLLRGEQVQQESGAATVTQHLGNGAVARTVPAAAAAMCKDDDASRALRDGQVAIEDDAARRNADVTLPGEWL